MVVKKRTAGRPMGGTSSLDEDILRFLMENERTAGWRQLKKVRGDPPVADGVLGTAIKRLVEKQQIVPEAILREGKAITIYRLPLELPLIWVGGKAFPLFTWISDTCDRLAETRKREDDGMLDVLSRLHPYSLVPPREDLKRFTLGLEEERLWDKMYPLPGATAALQGGALASTMQALGAIILGLIETACTTDVPAETEQYLGDATRIYLSVLIKEIAKLGDPAYGDLESAIRIAREQLPGAGAGEK